VTAAAGSDQPGQDRTDKAGKARTLFIRYDELCRN